MTEDWVSLTEFSTDQVGQAVQLDLGTNTIRGTLTHVYRNGDITIRPLGSKEFRISPEGWRRYAYDPQPTEGIPTEVGAYVDKYGHDIWTISVEGEALVCSTSPSSRPEKYAPFTQLVTPAAAVTEVLQIVSEAAADDDTGTLDIISDLLADAYPTTVPA